MAIIVKNTTFPGLMDLLAPHSCRGCGRLGEPLCDCCKNDILRARQGNICPNCGKVVDGFREGGDAKGARFLKYKPNPYLKWECPHCHMPRCFVVGERLGVLEKVIHDYKYDATRDLAKPLAELLDAVLPTKLPRETVIVPLPTVAKHVRARGMDHTLILARRLGRMRGLPVERCLVRAKDTVQVGATRKKRIKQAASAYALAEGAEIDPKKTYILLDDVWTTGASMKAAIELLRAAGAQKILAVLVATSRD